MKIKKIAFTLAETLVVMGVIGVIAALTIPNLSQSTADRDTIAKFKKSYAEMTEAFYRAQAIYGPVMSWSFTENKSMNSKLICDRVTEFMKVNKQCEIVNPSAESSSAAAILANGCKVRINMPYGTNSGLMIYLYTDPENKAEKPGVNYFYFGTSSYNDGEYRNLTMLLNRTFDDDLNSYKICERKGTNGCLSAGDWILKYDNMDYLKLDPTTGKCPNGTTPTEQNPRCN